MNNPPAVIFMSEYRSYLIEIRHLTATSGFLV
jgi:hypothetical protein